MHCKTVFPFKLYLIFLVNFLEREKEEGQGKRKREKSGGGGIHCALRGNRNNSGCGTSQAVAVYPSSKAGLEKG
jgi:hypothetical protein